MLPKSDKQLAGMSRIGGNPIESPQDTYLKAACDRLGIDKEELLKLGTTQKMAVIAFLSSSVVNSSGA